MSGCLKSWLVCHFTAQDGQRAVFARCGQVIAELENMEEVFLVLDTFKWAVMVWPLKEVADDVGQGCRGWQLDARDSAQCSWKFLHSPRAWVAWSTEKCWQDSVGPLLRASGPEEPFVQNSLRNASQFSFAELVMLAEYFEIPRPNRHARSELLRLLCNHFSVDFADEVLELESKPKAAKGFSVGKEFLSCILQNLEPGEKQHFDNLDKNLEKAKKEETQKRWHAALAEKTTAQRVPGLQVHLFVLTLLNCCAVAG